VNICPMHPAHKTKKFHVQWISNKKEMEEFLSKFKPATKKHKIEYKDTLMENIRCIDMSIMTAQEILNLRNTFIK